MIKHIWSVLCKESTINQEDNNLSIRDVFEALQVGLKPNPENPPKNDGKLEAVVPIPYEVTTLIARTDNEEETKVETEVVVFDPKGLEIGRHTHNFTIPKGKRRMRIRMKNTGLRIRESGDYIFKVSLREEDQKLFKTVAELPLEVVVTIDSGVGQRTAN